MQTALYYNQKRFREKEFTKEKDLEDLMLKILENHWRKAGRNMKPSSGN